MTSIFEKTDIKVDLNKLVEGVDEVRKLYPFTNGQICLTHMPYCPSGKKYTQGCGSLWNFDKGEFWAKEKDFSVFNSDVRNNYLYEIYKMVPFKVGRMRIMNLQPKRCYSYHKDSEFRYHVAIKTNPQSFLLIEEQAYHVPDDGYLYKVDTTRIHTALNANKTEERLHLVLCEIA